ncbi:MAG: cobalamin-dependent protein, partial [Xanthomonadaceae bacterium]|nr:cobalamin-dependent protein [Xanthomonadaceae bacterium]
MNQTAERFSAQSTSSKQPLRFVTAASLFDGHDAAINIMRRLIQAEGCEVIHLGHNRAVREIVDAAIQEDADGIAVSSYQGGHNEFFRYMVDMLRERGASHIRVFGGGGGTITPEEIKDLQAFGIERIYHPNDGMQMGLKPGMKIAVLAVDPTRRRTGGALLGDRIRFNTLRSERVFMRSMATRREHQATSAVLKQCIEYLRKSDFGLVLVETAGIGQADTQIVDLVDFPVYVMTSDYGAASQLEKIDMLDFAEMVILNKYEKRGAEDALRDIRKQWKRNRLAFDLDNQQVPVYPTIASQFNDPGITWMFANLCRLLRKKLELDADRWQLSINIEACEPRADALIPANRQRYLSEIAEQGRQLNHHIED